MGIIEAIEWHEEFIKTIENVGFTEDSSYHAAKVALVALREKLQREEGQDERYSNS